MNLSLRAFFGRSVLALLLISPSIAVAKIPNSNNLVSAKKDTNDQMGELWEEIRSLREEMARVRIEELKLFKDFMDGTKDETGPAGPPSPGGDSGISTKAYAPASCGGFVILRGKEPEEIIYRSPTNPDGTYEEICAWVVWAASGGPVAVKLKANSEVATFQSRSRVLRGSEFTKNKSHWQTMNSVSHATATFNSSFAEIFFHGISTGPDQGVHLEVRALGQSHFAREPKMVQLDVHSYSYNYKFPPSPESKYLPNDELFILVKGTRGRRLKVKIQNADVEDCCDWLHGTFLNMTNTYYPTNGSPVFGYNVPSKQMVVDYTSDRENIPFLVYFKSDGSNQGSGFNLEYSYV